MKTKNNLFVTVLVALITLFASEKVNAQLNTTSVPFTYKMICAGDSTNTLSARLENLYSDSVYINSFRVSFYNNSFAMYDSISVYKKGVFIGKGKVINNLATVNINYWIKAGSVDTFYFTAISNQAFGANGYVTLQEIQCTRNGNSSYEYVSASGPWMNLIDCSIFQGPYFNYGYLDGNNTACFDSLVNVLSVRVDNYDRDSLIIKGFRLSMKDGYSGSADSVYIYLDNIIIGKYKITNNKANINNVYRKVAPHSESRLKFITKSSTQGGYSLVLDSVLWKYQSTDSSTFAGLSGTGYSQDCSLSIKINIISYKNSNLNFCETDYVHADRQIKSLFNVIEENWYINGTHYPITTTQVGNMSLQIPLRTPYVDISVRIKDESGRTAYDSIRLNIKQNPVIKITATNGVICEGTPTVISIDTTGFKLANTKWGAEGFGVSSDNPVTYYFSKTGEYYFDVRDSNGCYGGTKISLQEIILPKPEIASIKCDLYADMNPSTNGYYKWYKNYNLLDTSLDNHYRVSSPGYYQVRFKDNTSGCLSKFASTFAECSATGIEESNSEKVKVYPNPFTDKITIESEIGSKFVFVDVNGKIIHEGILQSQREEISIDTPPGIYILQLSNGDKTIHRKIVRE